MAVTGNFALPEEKTLSDVISFCKCIDHTLQMEAAR